MGIAHPAVLHSTDRRNGIAGIVDLMPAEKLRQRQIEEAVLVLEHQPAMLLVGLPVLIGDEEGGIGGLSGTFDFIAGFIGLSADDADNITLEDAGLLMRDRRQRIAQILLMIVVDGCNDGEGRSCDDIGGVEASAEADFEKHIVGGLVREGEERRRRRDLKKRDRLAAIRRLAFLKEP